MTPGYHRHGLMPMHPPSDTPPTASRPTENALRVHLGIPASGTEVVIVAESSHWDPDWLLSADRYYRYCVRPTLDCALNALAAEPRRVFSLECLFFVDRYWQDRPRRRGDVVERVNEGRLRFTGCGVTTPDTLLPEDELLLRDLLMGQEWLRTRGMDQEPRLLYLPDSFGHSPGLPALLATGGIDYAAVCRIDGMRFPGADLEPAANFPRPGTTAERLAAEGTADFVWRSPDGSEILTHWMAHGYGHGDLIAGGGLSRVMGLPAAWPDRRPRHVDTRVEEYLAGLRRVSRTPYRLLVIGSDFVRPVPRLVELLDDWNERHHDRTGTWLVNAGIDDYLDLVSHHRSELPTIEADPNPYWMGFYATRPDIKAGARELGRRLVALDAHDATSVLLGESDDMIPTARRPAWWIAATSNHHDFVTGTSPDRVAHKEQAAWLASAIEATPWPEAAEEPPVTAQGEPLRVHREGDRVVVAAPWGTATFDSSTGGALVGLTDHSGAQLLTGPSLELRAYTDSGGLWRLGNELHGGRFALSDRSTDHPATIEVDHRDDVVRVHVHTSLAGRTGRLHHTFRSDDPAIVTRTSLDAPRRRTVTLAVHPRAALRGVIMHQPGGVIDRPLRRWYEPTYWPLHSFAITRPAQPDAGGVAVATGAPTGLHVEASGATEVIVARTAVKEIAFGVVPVMAPAWGWRWGRQEAVVVLGRHDPERHRSALDLGRHLSGIADRAVGHVAPEWPFRLDDPDVEVTTVKTADRLGGIIVRLRDWAPTATSRDVTLSVQDHLDVDIVDARLTDSRERDLEDLVVTAEGAQVRIRGHLNTVRLHTRPHRGQPGT